jgi:uncharacterized protein YbjT (DUF2867 family)
MMAKVILAGATGLVGRGLANLLSGSTHEVHVIGRRKVDGLPDTTLQHISPTSAWPDLIALIKADVAISCLGTTMKQAGSKGAFAAVDLDLVLEFARAAKQGGAEQMISASSTMAAPDSNSFYLKTKGQAEQGIVDMKFRRVDFMRPGLLRGNRDGSIRPGEMMGMLISPLTDMLLMGGLRKYRSISAENVARAMANLVDAQDHGRFIHENDAILSLAG